MTRLKQPEFSFTDTKKAWLAGGGESGTRLENFTAGAVYQYGKDVMENEKLRKEYDDYISGRPGEWYVVKLKNERDTLLAENERLNTELVNREYERNTETSALKASLERAKAALRELANTAMPMDGIVALSMRQFATEALAELERE